MFRTLMQRFNIRSRVYETLKWHLIWTNSEILAKLGVNVFCLVESLIYLNFPLQESSLNELLLSIETLLISTLPNKRCRLKCLLSKPAPFRFLQFPSCLVIIMITTVSYLPFSSAFTAVLWLVNIRSEISFS